MEHATSLDITNRPELTDLAERVRITGEAIALRVNDEDIAFVIPAREQTASRTLTTAQIEAVKSAAGGWKGNVDTEELKARLIEERGSDRAFRRL